MSNGLLLDTGDLEILLNSSNATSVAQRLQSSVSFMEKVFAGLVIFDVLLFVMIVGVCALELRRCPECARWCGRARDGAIYEPARGAEEKACRT